MIASETADWRATLKRRTLVAAGVLVLWTAGIEARLVYLQVYRRADLMARADKQQTQTLYPPPKRGDIVDRRGRVLATSVDADTIYAVPADITQPAAVVAKLCDALGDCTVKERQTLVERLGRGGAFSYVRRQISPEQKRRVDDLNLDSIGFIKESKRFYPNRELAAHLLGWVGIDNTGLSGLEYTYDPQIRGKAGQVLVQTDARRHAASRAEWPATAGSTVELTIDAYLQHVAERELARGVAENHAAGGTAGLNEPHTRGDFPVGERATIQSKNHPQFDDAERRNRGRHELYQPGSPFKGVT